MPGRHQCLGCLVGIGVSDKFRRLEVALNFPEFRNEPLTDFSNEDSRRSYAEALKKVSARLPLRGKLLLGGEWIEKPETFESFNPSRKSDVIGRFAKGARADAVRAVDAAAAAFETWKNVPAKERCDLLVRIAAILRNRKHEFSAMMTVEAGKTWPEADADTAEAIDFCEFYAREMWRLAQPQPVTPVPGERGFVEFLPLGVGAVIPPWNFPLAILAGMTTRRDRRRQHGRPEARVRHGRHRDDVRRGGGRGRNAFRSPEFRDRSRGGSRQRARRIAEGPLHRVHGVQGRRPGDQRKGREGPERADLDQARDPGDGRQRLHPRRRDGRPRIRRDGSRRRRVRLPGAEVLRLLAADRGRTRSTTT